MKKYLLLFTVVFTLASCGNSSKQDSQEVQESTEQAKNSEIPVYTFEELLAQAETLVGNPVKVKGYVTHTCKHSGRRCFLAGEDQKVTMRVEAKGKIGGFNRELIGSQIEVDGILRENRLSPDKINEMEIAINEKSIKNDGSAEACDTETANIQKMRDWMKENGKDYYSIYYIDGEDYNEVK